MTGSIVTNNGLKIITNRAFKSTPDYLAPSKFKIEMKTIGKAESVRVVN